MTALLAIVIFFFIFVLVYLAISVVVTAAAGWMKHRVNAKNTDDRSRKIARRADRIKDKAFVIALVLTFFVVTPFVVILWVIS